MDQSQIVQAHIEETMSTLINDPLFAHADKNNHEDHIQKNQPSEHKRSGTNRTSKKNNTIKTKEMFATTEKEYFKNPVYYIPRPEWFLTPSIIISVPNESDKHIRRKGTEVKELQRCTTLLDIARSNEILKDVQQEIIILLIEYYKCYVIYYDNTDDTYCRWKIAKSTMDVNKPQMPYYPILLQHMDHMLLDGTDHHENKNELKGAYFGKDNDTILHLAIKQNATKAAIDIIHIELNTVSSIIQRLYRNRIKSNMTLKLIMKHSLLERKNKKGYTPLILAAQKGNLKVVELLIHYSVDQTCSNNTGVSIVAAAAKYGHTKIINFFMDNLHNFHRPFGKPDNNQNTPLMHAIQGGHVSIVPSILSCAPFFINRTNSFGMNPLLLAARLGYDKICQLLIKNFADVDVKNKQDCTPLILACKHGHVNVVRVVVAAGCDLFAIDNRQRSAESIIRRRIVNRRLLVNEPQPPPNRNNNNNRRRRGRHHQNRNIINDDANRQHQIATNAQEDDDEVNISNDTDETILHLLDPLTQIDLMKLASRTELNYEIVRVSTLMHTSVNNVTVRIFHRNGVDYSMNEIERDTSTEAVTTHTDFDIPAILQWIDSKAPNTTLTDNIVQTPTTLVDDITASHCRRPIPKWFCDKGIQALIRMMTLPAPLIQIVSSYIPLPLILSKRCKLIRLIAPFQPNEAIVSALDLMDEVLEEMGFLCACDAANVPAPNGYTSWFDWKRSAISKYQYHYRNRGVTININEDEDDIDDFERSSITNSISPQLQDMSHPTMYELRRQIGYIPLLTTNEALLTPVLVQSPYLMPEDLIKSLTRITDVVSLCRRCLCRDTLSSNVINIQPQQDQRNRPSIIQFDAIAARDIISLMTYLSTWYQVLRRNEGDHGSDTQLGSLYT